MSKSQSAPPAPSDYEGLDFDFADLQREISNFAKVSRRFLKEESRYLLNEWLTELVNFHASQHPGSWKWSIHEAQPIRTQSTNEYEPGNRRGAFSVYGELSSVWEITLKGTRRGAGQVICLNGIASTKVKIFRQRSDGSTQQIAQWQIEVGDRTSPGCHFHVGIGQFGETGASLSVPRLPSLLFTPIDALDFLLGELFQAKWKETVSDETQPMQIWSEQQRKRLFRLLKWKQDQIDHSGGSAWNYLKHQRPHAKIFLT
jgi:hypothetical protein